MFLVSVRFSLIVYVSRFAPRHTGHACVYALYSCLFGSRCFFCVDRSPKRRCPVARRRAASAASSVAATGSAARRWAAAAAAQQPLLATSHESMRPPASSLAGDARSCAPPSFPDHLALLNNGNIPTHHITHAHSNSPATQHKSKIQQQRSKTGTKLSFQSQTE